MKKNEESLWETWDSTNRTNTPVIGAYQKLDRVDRVERIIKEIITENFPTLERDAVMQIRKGQRSPVNATKPTPGLQIKKPGKDKERGLAKLMDFL